MDIRHDPAWPEWASGFVKGFVICRSDCRHVSDLHATFGMTVVLAFRPKVVTGF